jgi:hypothetical protein
MDVSLEATETCLEKAKEPTSAELEYVAVHPEVHMQEDAVEIGTALNKRHRDRKVEVGRREKRKEWTQRNGGCPQDDDPQCGSGISQRTRSSGTRQGQCRTKNLERTEGREEMPDETGRQPWHKEPRLQGAATS